ncbi:SAM-dependent methyltransferase [Gorillibacterium massiliense]|uniref:SAM-dependent methyltransferase n=1 Tax=Gorillibacterium massiliense TaxID=1280390 RepID=UPI00307B4F94
MFDLTIEEIPRLKILDAPAGACSFTAVANAKGGDVTAIDLAYFHPVDELYGKGQEDIQQAVSGLAKAKENFVWETFEDIASLESNRQRALEDCIAHMKISPDRYIPCVLPDLPFSDEQFDLTLSAHFLFMYADRLDFSFHLQVIKELLRVTKKEVRIFPLVDLMSNRYENLDAIKEAVHELGWKTEERLARYEFQRGANSFLRIYRD